jgi:predicted amidohydrolase
MAKIRVAAAQFYTGTNVADNLATVLRMIDEAAIIRPDVLVLPEFCNHSSWYPDRDYSYRVAVDLDPEDPFLEAVGRKVAEVGFYVMLNCTVRRDNHEVTGTNILFDPDGRIVASSDKQVLMGNENNFLSKAKTVCPVLETPLGRIGMYSCMDGVINETPRSLALRGGQVLLNSLNSFALDEGSLHVPVRAAENKVFIVAANKVGLLVPDDLAPIVAQRVGLRVEQLHGAGESQIVAPDSTVLAKAPLTGEAVIYADIDPTDADNKLRPDGSHIFDIRTPQAYHPLTQPPQERHYNVGAERGRVAVLTQTSEVIHTLRQHPDLELLVLPQDAFSGTDFLQQLLREANSTLWLATSITTQAGLRGYLLNHDTVHTFHPIAETLAAQAVDLPFGRVSVLVGSDAILPEAFRLCALQNVELVICPVPVQERWELTTGFVERAAENRMSVIVATLPSEIAHSAIFTLSKDFTLWTHWERPFDGNINYPLVTRMNAGEHLLVGEVYPANSGNRLVSQKTDVVEGRPYWLLKALVN